jgi:hypothetical protein
LPRGVYPERDEILRFAQNDRKRRARNDTENRDRPSGLSFFLSLDGRKGGQASSEDLFPLGYGEWERIRVRVKPETIPLVSWESSSIDNGEIGRFPLGD